MLICKKRLKYEKLNSHVCIRYSMAASDVWLIQVLSPEGEGLYKPYITHCHDVHPI